MPEDQGVNGNFWNDEAAVLLTKLNWKQIGDSNMDIVDEDYIKRGIDRLFQFNDVRKGNALTGVFLEAKRYATTSFQKASLELWIKTLDKKLNKVRNSEGFHETYPLFGNASLRTGLIVIWFHDLEAYPAFKSNLYDYLTSVKLSGYGRNDGSNKIYILHNEDILRIASIINTIETFETVSKREVNFFYPSSDRYNKPADRSKVLSLDYMFSKFILAESLTQEGIEHKIVFYFGALSVNSFRRLKNALQSFGYIDKKKPLTIYSYQRNDSFRKVKQLVEQEFEEIIFKLEEMEIFYDLPKFLRLQ